jgi:hypothetical protein
MHHSETLYGWQYRSKGEVKEVKVAGHRVTECVRYRDWTHLVSSPGTSQGAGVIRLWLEVVIGPRQITIPMSSHGDMAWRVKPERIKCWGAPGRLHQTCLVCPETSWCSFSQWPDSKCIVWPDIERCVRLEEVARVASSSWRWVCVCVQSA